MLTLYMSPGSSSMATHIALHEVGAPFEARWLDFSRKEQLADAFRTVNPAAKVPALIADGQVITEVAATLYWLARRFPAAGLWPEGDLAAEADAVSWMSFVASTLHPARGKGGDAAREAFGLADQRLGDRRWALGDRYSVADIHLFRLFWRLKGSMKPAPDVFPGLERHHAAMMARPAVQRTLEAEGKVGYQLPA